MTKKIEDIDDLIDISQTAAAELGLKKKKPSKKQKSKQATPGGTLKKPETNRELEACQKAQEYLSCEWNVWPLPSKIEVVDETVTLAWFVYEDTWPYDAEPNFTYSMAIPSYVLWGKKKRDNYLKEQAKQLDKVYEKRRQSYLKYGPNKDSNDD